MRIVVVGAGVVGVTTAYVLARQGHRVTVIEREPRAAMESSFANGGQLSFGFAAPMASPGLLRKAPAIMFGRDPAFRLPLGFVLRHLRWTARFAYACLPTQGRRNGRELLALARESREALNRLCDETQAEFERRRAGKLIVFSSKSELSSAARGFDQRGLPADSLTPAQCHALDPATQQIKGPLAGGIWLEQDELGDAERFCRVIATHSQDKYGVSFLFNDSVDSITTRRGAGVTLSTTTGQTCDADAVVLCTGGADAQLLKKLGIRLPIVPVTGYSLTAPPGPGAPSVAITDADGKFVCSRIGEVVRIAGFADFGHLDEPTRQRRIEDLIRLARQRFPLAALYSQPTLTWSGVRPATPTSLPIVGPSSVPGVFLNMGHGMYGWTLSAAAAEHTALNFESHSGQQYAA